MKEILGNRRISISREITKKFEEVYRGTIESVLSEVENAKGEFVLVVSGNTDTNDFSNLTILEHVNLYIREGHEVMDAIKLVAKERHIPKSEVYNTYHK